MTHTQAWWSNRYKGLIEVELANGKKLNFAIYKDGSKFWVDEHLVHPSNSGSIEGAIHEIGILHDSPVKEWKWIT